MGEITDKVRKLERIFRALLQSAISEDPTQLTSEQNAELVECSQIRGVWMDVKDLEEAEIGYREQAAEAARRNGVSTARLVMAGLETGQPSVFILSVPTVARTEEAKIAKSLQFAIQTMIGGVLYEHEMLKATMAATITNAGTKLPEMSEADRAVLYEAMRTLDFETIASALGLGTESAVGYPDGAME